MKKTASFFLATFLSSATSGLAQNSDLSTLFARRYLNVAIGKVSSTSKSIYNSNPSSHYPSTTVWDNSFSLGFGYSLDKIKNNLFFEYNLNNNRYWNYTIHSRSQSNKTNHTYAAIFHWVNEFGLKQYFSLNKNKLYLSPFAGINFTSSRASSPNSEFSYDYTEGHWFRYTSPKIKAGLYGGVGLNYKINKRILLYTHYKFQSQLSSKSNLGEIKYISGNNIVSDEFKSKIKPFNSVVSFGISFSLENSAFYTK